MKKIFTRWGKYPGLTKLTAITILLFPFFLFFSLSNIYAEAKPFAEKPGNIRKTSLTEVVFQQEGIYEIHQQRNVSGTVADTEGVPLPGVNVTIKGSTTGAITNLQGNYTIAVSSPDDILVFSFVGFQTQEIQVSNQTTINITLEEDIEALEEVIVVGYGVQKKESVVGSIAQTQADELMKSGGVTTVGQAISGKIPGVVTIASTGRPGEEQPEIFIRGQGTWNGTGQPLVLIDGIERAMNDIDIGNVESISVLKDASATAVFGVRGANGVILIKTKRGISGKAQLSINANSTVKVPAKLPKILNSYDGIMVMNEAIERTVSSDNEGWPDYIPMEIAEKYRNPANEMERVLYPNVDWQDEVLKDFAMDHRINLSVRGGTDFAKYFGSLTYQHVGDIYKGAKIDNGRSYSPDLRFDRFNYRANVDFNVTKTTKLSVNLSGYYGIKKTTDSDFRNVYGSLYMLPPSLYYPIYDDGTFGQSKIDNFDFTNPLMELSTKGTIEQHRVQVNSDFLLDQDLSFLLEGLRFNAALSYDNLFRGDGGIRETRPGGINNVVFKVIENDGSELLLTPDGVNQFDYVITPWNRTPLDIQGWNTERQLFYQFSFLYDKTFASAHNLSVLALMNRQKFARGSMMPNFREDWVGRVTYNYADRYFFEVNGAYNGSEKFGPEYRFQLFPSIALGWMLSNEPFMDNSDRWLSRLKFRGSYGLVGDDSGGQRWAYVSQWSAPGGNLDIAYLDHTLSPSPYGGRINGSPYLIYREDILGNPDLRWETATKMNFGLDLGLFRNMFSFSADYFYEHRTDIIIAGGSRNVPSFTGINPPDSNVGETEVRGIELEALLRYNIRNDWLIRVSGSYSLARDKILYREDPELQEDYRKQEGFSIGQPRISLPTDIMTNWDEVYASSPQENFQFAARPGYYNVIDFNGDGIININDNVPYGFPIRPQNTWSGTIGTDFKNWSLDVQFFGAYNAMKTFVTNLLTHGTPMYWEHAMDYWSINNSDGTQTLMSYRGDGHVDPLRNWYDASFVQLKNVEIAYTFSTRSGSSYRIYANGNDLVTWSSLPDERQANGGGTGEGLSGSIESTVRGNYPMFRRFNLGVNINF
jgi:TonB-linked SusC/RagA family outer membrane protein